MPNATYILFRNAILREQQVVCSYDGRVREFCPHIIGTSKSGESACLAVCFRAASPRAQVETGCVRCDKTTRRANHFGFSEFMSSPRIKNISPDTSGKSLLQ